VASRLQRGPPVLPAQSDSRTRPIQPVLSSSLRWLSEAETGTTLAGRALSHTRRWLRRLCAPSPGAASTTPRTVCWSRWWGVAVLCAARCIRRHAA